MEEDFIHYKQHIKKYVKADHIDINRILYPVTGKFKNRVIKKSFVLQAIYDIAWYEFNSNHNPSLALFSFNMIYNLGGKEIENIIGDIGVCLDRLGLTLAGMEAHTKYFPLIKDSGSMEENQPIAIFNIGSSYEQDGKYDEAIIEFQKALKHQALNDILKAEILYSLGVCYSKKKMPEDAEDNYNKCLLLNPNHIKATINQCIILLSRNPEEETKQAYSLAIKFEKDNNTEIYKILSECAIRFNHLHMANMFLHKCIKIDVKNKDLYFFLIARNYIRQKQYSLAVPYLNCINIDYLNLIISLRDIDQGKHSNEVLSILIDKQEDNSFFKSILKKNSINNNSPYYSIYKTLFIKSLHITSLLTLSKREVDGVAHYTSKVVTEALLFEFSPMRLSPSHKGNDPNEGLMLQYYLDFEEGSLKRIDNAMITCFNMNKDSLNHFRLYGNDKNKPATGISLVFDSSFFLPQSSSTLDHLNKSNSSLPLDSKLPLLRCVYIDKKTKRVISIAHIEEDNYYSKYPNENESDYETYMDEMNALKATLKEELIMLKSMVEDNNLNLSIVDELLFTLKHLIKNSSFKHEQECRIIKITDPAKSKNYSNYFLAGLYLKEIILGSNTLEKRAFINRVNYSKDNRIFKGEVVLRESDHVIN